MSQRRLRLLAALLAAPALVVLLWGAWDAYRVAAAAGRADAATDALRAAAEDRDLRAAEVAGHDLASALEVARSALSATPARVAAGLPVLGDDVEAAALAVDRAADVAGPASRVASAAADALGSADLDLDRLAPAQQPARELADAVERASADLAAVETSGLVPALRNAYARAVPALEAAQQPSRILSEALPLLPSALGADQPRSYLLVVQNPAEARPTGGIVGAWGVVAVEEGEVRVAAFEANDTAFDLRADLSATHPSTAQLYGPPLELLVNTNLTASFPAAAPLMASLAEQHFGVVPDGVVSVDPLALAALLQVTGPVTPADGQPVDAASAPALLMAEVYERFGDDQAARTAYLTSVTAAVTDAVVEDGLSDPAVLGALASAGARHHVQLWMRDPTMQALAVEAGVSGHLPPAGEPVAAAGLTNVDGSKLDYYLRWGAAVVSGPSGGPAVEVVLDYAPPPAVPPYAANQTDGSVDHAVVLSVHLPPAAGVERVLCDGAAVAVAVGAEVGWRVVRLPLQLRPGSTTTVVLELAPGAPVEHVAVAPRAHDSPRHHEGFLTDHEGC